MLYFSPGDVNKARSLLESAAEEGGQAGPQQKSKAQAQLKHNMESLNAVAAYAENKSQCRRVLLMKHFGEEFSSAECRRAHLKELSCRNVRLRCSLVLMFFPTNCGLS